MRLKEFQSILKKKGIDFALFTNLDSTNTNPNLFYFSGYSGIGALAIGQKKAFMLVPRMEYERAKKSRIREVYAWSKKGLFESISEKIRKNKIKKRKAGIDKTAMTLNEYSAFKKLFKKSKTTDISAICRELREIKTGEEIKIIRKACEITDDIMVRCIKNFKKFRYETDVAAFLEQEARKAGASPSFPPIVASGEHSSQPHYGAEKMRLKKGFCIIDWGVKYKGYCSDITRTIYIGKPSKKESELYSLLLKVQKEAITRVGKEKKTSDIVRHVKRSLGNYNKNFIHGLGHGIGVELHELPNLKEKDGGKLKENSILTIEPGVYFAGRFGIRIEDDILIGKKAEILTKISKDLLVV